jgi:ribosomal protein S18 acetylase RimI-like enzyme
VPTELERALAFEESLRVRSTERIVPFRFGRAYFNDSFPLVWDLNALVVSAPNEIDPGELAADAELLHTDAGHAHRRADVTDDAVGASLERFFKRLGWQIDRTLVMAHRGEAERQGPAELAVEVTRDDLLPFRMDAARAEPWATSEEVVRQVTEAGFLWEKAGNARYFAVQVDGVPVAAAELYSDGRVAQVENVATLPDHRGQGYASAVVVRAIGEALTAGSDLVFICAEENDWPKELYARLGFETVGRTWSFLRTPALIAPD